MWLLTILVIVMNIPVFIVTRKLQETSEATKIAMFSLATSDVVIGIQAVFRLSYFAIIGQYSFDIDILCSIDGILHTVLSGVSILTLVFLCIDRVITIKFPLRYPIYFTKKKVTLFLVSIWLFIPLLFSMAHWVFGKEIVMVRDAHYCVFAPVNKSVLALIILALGYILPVCIIFTCAVILYHTVYQQIHQIRALENATPTLMERIMAQKRAIRTIFCMVGGYYICWCPVMVAVVWGYLSDYSFTSNQAFSPTTEAVICWFSFSNSLVNSLIYLPTMREYRKIFKKTFIPKMCSSEEPPNL